MAISVTASTAPPTPARPKYTIQELLSLRQTLPILCFPKQAFKYKYGIIKGYPVLEPSDDTAASPIERLQHQFRDTSLRSNTLRRGTPTGLPPLGSQGHMPTVPSQTSVGEHRRYVSSPMSSQFSAFHPDLGISSLHQGLLRSVHGVHPEAADAYIRRYRMNAAPLNTAHMNLVSMGGGAHPMNPALFYQSISQNAGARIGPMALDLTAIPQRPAMPLDLSGGYPGITIGAAGYTRGHAPQGFVPGGTLKSGPVTGLTPTAEKGEPNWPASPTEPNQYDPNRWVADVNRSAFEVLQDNDPSLGSRRGSKHRQENVFGTSSHGKINQSTTPQTTGSGKAKGKESQCVNELEMPPPPPMLGIRSNSDEQRAWIAYMMMKKGRSVSSTQKKKESLGASYSADSSIGAENIRAENSTW